MATDTFKNESKKEWYDKNVTKPSNEQLQLGCMQRIAEASEMMAKNFNDLIRENQLLKRQKLELERETKHLAKSNAAYRGQITKLKKQFPNE